MATLNPKLMIKMGLDAAGVTKGAKTVSNTLMGLSKQMGTAEKHSTRLGKSLGAMWRISGGIILFNIIRKITHALQGLIQTTFDFEEAMYNVNSVAQLSDGSLKILTDQVLDLALDPRIKDGPALLAQGLYTITSAGYSTSDAMIILENAAMAATAGMTTTAVASDVLISTLGAYGLTAKDAAATTDKLFQIVNISKYTFEDMASAMDSVTPSASSLGITIEEIGASMATMAARGVDAETATVQMNAIITGMLKPTEAMTKALLDMGYASGSEMLEKEGFVKTMQIWEKYLNGNEDLAAEVFGDVRALRGIMNLTAQDAVPLTNNLEKMGEAQEGVGATAKALEQQMKSNSFQMAVLKKNIQVIAVMIFMKFAPYLNKALRAVNSFITGMIEDFNYFHHMGLSVWASFQLGFHKTLTRIFGLKVANMALKFFHILEVGFMFIKRVVLTTLDALGKGIAFVTKHFDYFGPAIMGAVIAMGAFAAVLLVVSAAAAIATFTLSPLIVAFLVVAAIGAFVALAWYKNWGDIQGKTETAVEFIGKWAHKLWDFIQPVVDVIKRLGTYWKQVMTHEIEPGNLKNIPGWLRPIALVIGRIIKTLRVFFKTWHDQGFMAALKKIPAQIRAFGRAFAGVFDQLGLHRVADIIRKDFKSISDIFKNVVELVDNLVHGRWRAALGNLGAIAHDAFDMLINRMKLIPNLIRDLWDVIPWTAIGQALWNGLKAAGQFLVDTGIPWLLVKGYELLQGLYNGFVSFWDETLAPWLTALPGVLFNMIVSDDTFNLLWGAGNFLLSGLWEGVKWAWDWGTEWFKDLPGRLLGYFGTNPDKMLWQVGALIIMGLWNGIVWAWNWMITQIETMWNSLPDFAKKLWNIMSPSKVFADIGKQIPAGLAVGIESSMGKVTKAMGAMNTEVGIGGPSMRASAFNSGASAGAAASTGGTRVTVNFQAGSVVVQNSEESGEMVVRHITRAIRRLEAGRA